MLNNFIYAQTKALFEEHLLAGNILDEAIVFIEDTKEIWNHGTYFGGADVSKLENSIEGRKGGFLILQEINERISYLKNIVSQKEKALENASDDSIHVCSSNTKTQFYLIHEKQRKSEIEQEYGAPFVWERLTDKVTCRIKDTMQCLCFDVEDKTPIFEFICKASERMAEIFHNYILDYSLEE